MASFSSSSAVMRSRFRLRGNSSKISRIHLGMLRRPAIECLLSLRGQLNDNHAAIFRGCCTPDKTSLLKIVNNHGHVRSGDYRAARKLPHANAVGGTIELRQKIELRLVDPEPLLDADLYALFCGVTRKPEGGPRDAGPSSGHCLEQKATAYQVLGMRVCERPQCWPCHVSL